MRYLLLILSVLLMTLHVRAEEEQTPDVKMNYIGSFDEAKGISRRTGKPIFINFHARWAGPCRAMDKYVFSDGEFARFMDKNFVNYFVDVKTPEGKEMVKTYEVPYYAYFAIVDCNGKMIQPVGAGAKLPEFRNNVSLALSPKTSLAGTKAVYESGKYSKKELRNYINALRVAGIGKDYHSLINEYIGMLSPKEYLQKENWDIIFFERDRNNSFFRYVTENKPLFVKKFGEEAVNDFLARAYAKEAFGLAAGDSDPAAAEAFGKELATACLPDTAKVSVVYNIGRLRAERRYPELFSYMDEYGRYLEAETMLRQDIERSFSFPALKGDDREAYLSYLRRAIDRETPANAAKLKDLLKSVTEPFKGIMFESAPLEELLGRAGAEGKSVFVDCYTSWCGPCRLLATKVFTREDVGNYFNEKFVNTKIDMEKGEGPELAKKYGVSAFPTMLILDAQGNVINRIVGYQTPEVLLDKVGKTTAE